MKLINGTNKIGTLRSMSVDTVVKLSKLEVPVKSSFQKNVPYNEILLMEWCGGIRPYSRSHSTLPK